MKPTLKYSYTVAVVIPNWNGEKYLSAMLDSILEQTFKDFKVFVVDDQSTDNSVDILREYASQDTRIYYQIRNKEPKGGQTCRNIGFDLSVGAKYVLFFDNDDLIAPFCLEQRVTFMEEHPENDFAIFPAISFNSKPSDRYERVWGCRFTNDTLQAMFHLTLPMVGWTNIYRRDSYLNCKLHWDERIKVLQDSDFNIQALIKGCTFAYADNAKPDYFYRTATQSISTKLYKQESFDSYIILIKKILANLSPSQLTKYNSDLRGYIIHFAIIMVNSPIHLLQLSRLLWVREQRVFSLKLSICSRLPHRYKLLNLLFKKERNLILYHQQKWHELSTNKGCEFIKENNNPTLENEYNS